jgi:ketosteroid isomerase-like protein
VGYVAPMARPVDIVERLCSLGHERLAESLALLHPDAEFVPDPHGSPMRGHVEIRDYVAREIRRLGTPLPEAIILTLTEAGDRVLVYGQLRLARGGADRSHVEVRPIAWVYEVDGDRVSRVTVYPDFEQAREAAGVAPETAPTRRLHDGWLLSSVYRRLAARPGAIARRWRSRLPLTT